MYNDNSIIAMDMLPIDVEYDEDNHKLIRLVETGRGRTRTEALSLG